MMSLNATTRTHNVSKKLHHRLGKAHSWTSMPTLMLYSLLHQFIHQGIEGDELYLVILNSPRIGAYELSS